MSRRLLVKIERCLSQPKNPLSPIEDLKKFWDSIAESFNKFDFPQQNSYFSLLYMTELWKANNILEIGCGAGKMIPMALNMKRTEAGYLATDLSPVMIDLAKGNVKKHYEMFRDSKDYERWLERVSLFFRVADGEEFIEAHNG